MLLYKFGGGRGAREREKKKATDKIIVTYSAGVGIVLELLKSFYQCHRLVLIRLSSNHTHTIQEAVQFKISLDIESKKKRHMEQKQNSNTRQLAM